jgi:hypothetical protein
MAVGVLGLLLQSCPAIDPPVKYIKVYNDTDSVVYVSYAFFDTMNIAKPLKTFKDDSVLIYRLLPHSTGGIDTCGRKSLIEGIPDKKIKLFFIKESVMYKYHWEEICKEKLFERKMTLTVSDLEKYKWKVIYRNPLK